MLFYLYFYCVSYYFIEANNWRNNKIKNKYDKSYKMLIFTGVNDTLLKRENMHEVSIAANILEIAEAELKKNEGRIVNKLHLEVGVISGVVVESLQFALDASRLDSVLKDTEIIIDEIPAEVKCRSCNFSFEADDYYVVCPNCQDIQLDFLSGRDLMIKSIIIS